MTTVETKRPKPRRAIRFTDLLVGLFPFAAGFLLVGALAYQTTRPLQKYYEQKAEALVKEGKYAEALACLKRLLTFDPKREEFRFALARTYEITGQFDPAEEIMRGLAPREGTGFPPAHLWLADRLAAAAAVIPAAAKESESHYLKLLKEYPKSDRLKRALGLLYSQSGRPNEAIPYLLDVAENDPEVLIAVARCYMAVGDKTGTQRYLRESAEAAKKLTESTPDAPRPWLFWGQATAGLGNYAEALEILKRGEARFGPEVFKKVKAALCLEWTKSLVSNEKQPPARRVAEALRVVLEGLDAEPANEGLEGFLNLMLLLKDPEGKAVREEVMKRAEAGEPAGSAAAARLALGNAEAARDRPEEALKQWETGYGLDPDLPILANNYAYALAHTGKTDPARALTVIDRALKSRQRDPRLLGTRGLILRQLGRPDDARGELERAIAGGNSHPDIKSALVALGGRLDVSPGDAPDRSGTTTPTTVAEPSRGDGP